MANNILESKTFKIIILSIAGLIVLAFIFGAGVFVGSKKAEFSFKWADQYHRNFGGPFINANGCFGQIIKIDAGNLTVKDRDNLEKVVLVSDKTIILEQRKNIKLSDLKIGDSVVVIGEPNDSGQIQAQLIRVMPAPKI